MRTLAAALSLTLALCPAAAQWTQIPSLGNGECYAIISSNDTLWAGMDNAVHISTDGGVRWTALVMLALLIANAGVTVSEFVGIAAATELFGVYRFISVPLAAIIAEQVQLPVALINDVRAITLGEWTFGAGRGADTVACLAIGTGIGGGVIVNGQFHLGIGGTAGEFGHHVVEADGFPCGCGGKGCLELYASGPAIAAMGVKEVMHGHTTRIGELVKNIKDAGLIAGVAGHELRTPKTVEAAGVAPDFYVKTLHNTNYWSRRQLAQKKEVIDNYGIDNYWCRDPKETIGFMSELNRPWIAYKVLAAGAILPRSGFRYAFENGADFALVGMFDFQVAEDVAVVNEVLSSKLDRDRAWMA